MSISARDQCWDWLPTRRISPLGTCHTVPSTERSRVVRRETASTVPEVSLSRLTMSPTPNWSSIRMKTPDRKSLDQRLRAEAERDAEDARAGQQRPQLDPDLAQDHEPATM